MKTNVPIDLQPLDLRLLADVIDGRETQRKATRAEIVAICQQHIAGLIETQLEAPGPVTADPANRAQSELYVVDPKDRPLMAQPDNPDYVRGWNQVKLSRSR